MGACEGVERWSSSKKGEVVIALLEASRVACLEVVYLVIRFRYRSVEYRNWVMNIPVLVLFIRLYRVALLNTTGPAI